MKSLTNVAIDLLVIAQYMRKEFYKDADYDDGDLYDFDQTWGSTALGFGGMGGQAITTARTYVFIPRGTNNAYVFFGNRFAYSCPINDKFREDLDKHRMASVMERGRYYEKDE